MLYVANCELAVELVYIGDSGASCIILCLREPIAKDIRLVVAEEDGRVPSVYLVETLSYWRKIG